MNRLPTFRAALTVALALLTACGATQKPDVPVAKSTLARNLSPQVAKTDADALVAGNTAFAAELFKSVGGTTNAMASPYSISLALAMTWAGSKGATDAAMAKALHFTLPQDKLHPALDQLDLALASRGQNAQGKDGKPFRLTISNAAWGEKTFDFVPAYLDTLATSYGAGVNLLDFIGAPDPSRLTINQWVAATTEDRIKDLLGPGAISSDTRLVLTNTVYFNAAWRKSFDPNETRSATFNLADGSRADVSMMSGEIGGSYGEGADFVAAELPYDGSEVAMTLVMSKTGTLAAFEATLDGPKLASITTALKDQTLLISLPKFKFDGKTSLGKALADLGMGIAFTEQADFSGIHAGGGIAISDVIHQTFVAVDEAGTEAAAATAVVIGTTSVAVGQHVTFDRPFLFVIRDVQTGTVLFLGHVYDPR